MKMKIMFLLGFAIIAMVASLVCRHRKIGRTRSANYYLSLSNEDMTNDFNNDIHSVTDRSESSRGIKRAHLEESLARKALSYTDSKGAKEQKERIVLVSVDRKHSKAATAVAEFTLEESLTELSELVGTANMVVAGLLVQKSAVNSRSYIGSGKINELVELIKRVDAKTIVVDDDLSPTQQRALENGIAKGGIPDAKVLDRTAVILDIFAQHAKSREGQLQVELAMLEYRMTRGPSVKGNSGDSGSGFRGPGETKLETDKRVIKDKIHLIKHKLDVLKAQRQVQRQERERSHLPLVALVGYTNAGKSTLMNRLTNAGVLAENMLFATLDPTTRRVRLPRLDEGEVGTSETPETNALPTAQTYPRRDFLLSDTVGFISKLPTQLVVAFRATLEEVTRADVLVLVCDRSNPVWEKQRNTVLRELPALNCTHIPVIEFWNKIDALPDADELCRMVQQTTTVDDPVGEGYPTYDPVEVVVVNGKKPLVTSNSSTQPKDKDDDEDNEDNEEYLSMTIDDVRPFEEEESRVVAANAETTTHDIASRTPMLKPRYIVAGSAKTGRNTKDLFIALSKIFHSLGHTH